MSDQVEAAGTSAEPPAGLARRLVGGFGAVALDLGQTGRELWSVLLQTLYYCFRGKREPGATSYYMYEIGNRSVFFITVVMGFIGMISIYQAGVQALRILPDLHLMGATYIALLIRDSAPTIGAMMLATRVGAGIAAEIGSMVVTEQVDALRMSAADPIDYLVKPRFIASIVMSTALLIWGCFVAFLTGMLTAYAWFDVTFESFMNLSLVRWPDLGTGLCKCLTYGAAIPIVAAHAGLSTFGGSEGVGWATTRSVVNCCLAVITLDLILSASSFLLFG
jgi:phospholipid/cholesterol/gamma-HCH transport system permease protein